VFTFLQLQVWDQDFTASNDSICQVVLPLKGVCRQALRTTKRAKITQQHTFSAPSDVITLKNLAHPNFAGSHGELDVSIELIPRVGEITLSRFLSLRLLAFAVKHYLDVSIELVPHVGEFTLSRFCQPLLLLAFAFKHLTHLLFILSIHIQADADAEKNGMGRAEPNVFPFLPPPEGRLKLSVLHPLAALKDLIGPEMYRKICCYLFFLLLFCLIAFMAPMVFSNILTAGITR
jgi:hypothetical protein